jgi:hypothetical protein
VLVPPNTHWAPVSVQVLLVQQGPPVLPHGWQVEVVRPVRLAVAQASSYDEHPLPVTKVEVGQQGSPELPQPQRPDLQLP